MSQPQHEPTPEEQQQEFEEAHTGPIKTPKQLVATVVASFLVPIIGIILLVNFVDFGARSGAGSEGMGAEAVAQRLQPVGRVEVRDMAGGGAARTGEQVYTQVCAACHAAGALNSPKFGDADAWGPRIKTGYEALLNSALKGKNGMPPQGGGDSSDVEIARAVVFMANKAGASFAEPKAPEAAASAASAPN